VPAVTRDPRSPYDDDRSRRDRHGREGPSVSCLLSRCEPGSLRPPRSHTRGA
jgi:hypothetical protein